MQPTGSNRSCRLSQDMNLNSKTHTESDIGLLVACKVKLSSEVIRWKTETLKLQKERDAAQYRAKELDQTVSKMGDRIRELEHHVMAMNRENACIKRRSVAIVDQHGLTAQPLSPGLSNYHSFPWPSAAIEKLSKDKEQLPPAEDWREVSQNLLLQMRSEMKDLQEISMRFNQEEESKEAKGNEVDAGLKRHLEQDLSSLTSEACTLKRYLLQQKNKLKEIVDYFNSASRSPLKTPKKQESFQSQPPQRLSDENFRDYFTKQLSSSVDAAKFHPKVSRTHQQQNMRQSTKGIPIHELSSQCQEDESPVIEEDRVCPICQMAFESSVPQRTFEDHVVDHLEAESASLLDQSFPDSL